MSDPSRANRYVEPFIRHLPPSERRKGELLVLFSALIGTSLAVIVIVTFIGGTEQMAPYMGTSAVVAYAAPWLLRRGMGIRAITHVLAVGTVGGVASVTPYIGGVYSVTLPTLVLIPLLTAFLAGFRAALVWTGICAAIVIAFIALEVAGHRWEHIIPEGRRPISHGLSLLVVFAGVTLFCRDYVRYRVEAGERLRRAADLADMLARLAELEQSVRSAASAFSQGEAGLADRMGQQTELGRRASMLAFDSVGRMLEHREDVLSVVGELLASKEAIDELIAATTRLGRRLELLGLNASLEAAKANEPAFGLVAGEIRRVTASTFNELDRMEVATRTIGDALGQLQILNEDHEVFAEEVRGRMGENAHVFDELTKLIGRVMEATKILESEATGHLDAVRGIAQKARDMDLA